MVSSYRDNCMNRVGENPKDWSKLSVEQSKALIEDIEKHQSALDSGKSSLDTRMMKASSKPSSRKSSGKVVVNVGGSYQDNRDYLEEREARIKKDLAEAKKLETERRLIISRERKLKEHEEDEEFKARKKSRWSKYNTKKNEKNEKTPKDIIAAGGNYIAEDIIVNETGKVIKPMKDAARYVKNVATDIVTNPKNQRVVKNTAKGVIGAAQGLTKELEKDMLAYGQAKALLNGADFSEEPIFDRNGRLVGFKRNIKQKVEANKKTNLGLKPAVQHRSNKPGPKPRKGTLAQKEKEGPVNTVKGGPTNNKNKGGPVNNSPNKPGPVNRVKGGPINNKNKPGPTAHRRSGVKLVKSKLPTLKNNSFDDFEGFESNNFEGFDKNSFAGFGKKSFAGFEKKSFAGFEKPSFAGFKKPSFAGFEEKEQFHPLTHVDRPRSSFESVIPPQEMHFSKNRHATGVKVRKSNVRSGLNFSKNRHTTDVNDEEEQ